MIGAVTAIASPGIFATAPSGTGVPGGIDELKRRETQLGTLGEPEAERRGRCRERRVGRRRAAHEPRVGEEKRRRDDHRQRREDDGDEAEMREGAHDLRLRRRTRAAQTRARLDCAAPIAPQTDAETIDPAVRAAFGRKLRAWYRRNARDLPWRRTRDAYEILVSELMLQQTQVSRVVTRYGEFLEQFPTLGDVARAEPARVMEAWEGLGYYARARNLHRLAQTVTDGGAAPDEPLPADPEALRQLPGHRRVHGGRGGVVRVRAPRGAGGHERRASPQARLRAAGRREDDARASASSGTSPTRCCRARAARRGRTTRRSWSSAPWCARRAWRTAAGARSGRSAGRPSKPAGGSPHRRETR